MTTYLNEFLFLYKIILNYDLKIKKLFQPTPRILKCLPKLFLLVIFCRKNQSSGSFRGPGGFLKMLVV